MKFVYDMGTLMPSDAEAAAFIASAEDGAVLEFKSSLRTPKQNNSMWKYCALLATALNDSGFDLRTFPFRDGLEIPFTKESVMSTFWRPIQDAMFDKESTRKLSTTEIQEVYQAVDRAISTRAGVHVEWPSVESMERAEDRLVEIVVGIN